ncbi:MAG: hypothetical protein O3B13_00425 [Planctomycetota bacterium]|nr:hypothetical protein [Planctomycetota bacterium]
MLQKLGWRNIDGIARPFWRAQPNREVVRDIKGRKQPGEIIAKIIPSLIVPLSPYWKNSE